MVELRFSESVAQRYPNAQTWVMTVTGMVNRAPWPEVDAEIASFELTVPVDPSAAPGATPC